MTPNPGPSPGQEAPRPMFDEKVCETMGAAIKAVLAGTPEVRSIAVAVDYHGDLNDAKVGNAVWMGRRGAVQRPDEVFGSLMCTLRLAETMLARAYEVVGRLREQAQVLVQVAAREAEKRGQEEAGDGQD